ncbi:MAG: glycosyltransferase [Chloroflexota bacterium]
MQTDASPDLSIIIVNWNVSRFAAHLLAIYFRYARLSRPGGYCCRQRIRRWQCGDNSIGISWVHLEACDENVGFPRGNNIGLESAQGRHVLLLNPDTEVKPNALQAMVDYLDSHHDIGALAAVAQP